MATHTCPSLSFFLLFNALQFEKYKGKERKKEIIQKLFFFYDFHQKQKKLEKPQSNILSFA